ncbi:L,D-transpeptidase family protein [Clostridium sp. 'White wine YQ']|uniref:L,D-transpeptidase family protein n=1 Tax=Clostridium sp. 'White wine YQ' TaxID=3027474 RepID=UPI0023657C4A|nr:L,D-transpeptidase family protein [Clostridium sp. 'White wine YQ']MDD7795468.1 L,D-transpeptidase family protein [Clostridium sp. 'White wine YQ']
MKKTFFSKAICFLCVFIIISNITVIRSSASDKKNNSAILIDLSEERLYLINKDRNTIIKSYIVASGKPNTPSPIGTWKVIRMGAWSGGFGTRWIGLNVPWGKYGIHGTNNPSSIGSEASHGCIRMFNKDIEELYEKVTVGMIVTIYAGPYGPFGKGLKTLKPGDRGADVLEIQRILKEKGYYFGKVDGVYGESMKKSIMEYRVENNLSINHFIDKELYKSLGIRLID